MHAFGCGAEHEEIVVGIFVKRWGLEVFTIGPGDADGFGELLAEMG